ncbi:MAG TPA: Ig-like domain repeat protein [Thermoanaerobaculia bacterium]|nr:Ig-like domain repeat protein [Thermoanaerobaculia bacterium]
MKRFVLLALFVPAALGAATKTWNGSAGDNWSNAANWNEGTPPQAGDELVFPMLGSATQHLNNDLDAATAYGSMHFVGTYDVNGNGVTLGGDITGNPTFHVPIALAASQTWYGDVKLDTDAPLDLGPYDLTVKNAEFHSEISGTGSLTILGNSLSFAVNTLTGSIDVPWGFDGRSLYCSCVMPGAVTLSNSYFYLGNPGPHRPEEPAVPQTGPLTFNHAVLDLFGVPAVSGDLTFDSGSWLVQNGDYGDVPLSVVGTVSLNNASLTFAHGRAPVGTVFMLIDNDGTDPVDGTFAGLPEGAYYSPSMQVSYRGGDGNDVIITVVPTSSTTLSATPNPALAGQKVTLTATVTTTPWLERGTVEFYDDGPGPRKLLGSVQFSGNTATMTTTGLGRGSHELSAKFLPWDGYYDGSTSPAILLTVNPHATKTALNVQPNPTRGGETTMLVATITSETSSLAPTGNARFWDGTTLLATYSLTGGAATAVVGPLSLGAHSLAVEYSPDSTEFAGSQSSAVDLLVETGAMPTTTTLAVTPDHSRRGDAVTMTASVTAPVGVPSGTVTFLDGNQVLATQPLSVGTISITTSALSAGPHALRAAFQPFDTGVAPSASPIVTHVVEEPVVRRRAAKH